MNLYYGILERLGEERFPQLRKIGGAPYSAEQSGSALLELEILGRRIGEVQGIFLVETESMDEYQKTLAGENSWFYSSGGTFTYRLNDLGFCIADREERVLFQSRAFTQEIIDTNRSGWQRFNAQFCDLESGNMYETTQPISRKTWGVEELYYPHAFEVLTRELTTDLRAVQVLRNLFEASVQTGNP